VKRRVVRPSRPRSTPALWARSLLNALLFFSLFMLLLPALAHRLASQPLPISPAVGAPLAAALLVGGLAVWLRCLDLFSRLGRGTPFPLEAPRELVTAGPFAVVRNPIMAAELAIVWAEVLYFASVGLLAYAVVLSGLAHLSVLRIEEPELRRRFGERYESYAARVPRWLPRLGRRR
jgi:protein-S-isoprenylcysteine O-methyltransferase Ste14